MAPDREFQVLVVGGGIAGLVAARSLAATGLDPVVVERAEQLDAVDGPVELWPDAMTLLSSLDLADAVRSVGTTLDCWTLRGVDGAVERRLQADESTGFVVAEYGRLREALSRMLPENAVRTDTNVSGLRNDGHSVTVEFDNGVTEQFDVVVGADGVRSTTREAIGRSREAIGRTDSAVEDTLSIAFPAEPTAIVDGATEQWDLDGAILRAFDTGERTWGSLTIPPISSENAPPVTETVTEYLGRVDWLGSDAVPDSAGDVLVREDTRVETGSLVGHRVALVGDAARTRHRLTGLGTTLAVEDAVALTTALTNGQAALPERLEAYAHRRRTPPERNAGTVDGAVPRAEVGSAVPGPLQDPLDTRCERLAATFAGSPPEPAVDEPLSDR